MGAAGTSGTVATTGATEAGASSGAASSAGMSGAIDGAASACCINSTFGSPRARFSYSSANCLNSSRARGVLASSASRWLASALERASVGSFMPLKMNGLR